MHTYHIAPIDFGWENLKSVSQTASELGSVKAKLAAAGFSNPDPFVDVDDFLTDWRAAQDLASGLGWEGDFKNDPVVFWVPAEDRFIYGFAFKQDNNGSTFVVSPVPLPWLK
jgi:hypothetical protein